MNLLMGIGNSMRRDDGAGIYIAESFRHPDWVVLNCGTAPENFTSVVRRNRPAILVLVDAADMGLAPGELRVIPEDSIVDAGIGTHQLPLSHLIHYLRDDVERIVLIGIQPADIGDGEEMSSAVRKGVEQLMELLRTGGIDTLTTFAPVE